MPAEAVKIAILDDHQGIIDGYIYRLNKTPGAEVVATAKYGEDLEPMLQQNQIDVLLLDISVPASERTPILFQFFILSRNSYKSFQVWLCWSSPCSRNPV